MGTTGKLTVCPACKDIITLTHTIFNDLVCEACYHDIVEDLGTDIVPAKHPLVTIIADGIMKGRSVVVKEVGHNQANLMIGDELIDRITCTAAPVDTADNAAAAYCDKLIRAARDLLGVTEPEWCPICEQQRTLTRELFDRSICEDCHDEIAAALSGIDDYLEDWGPQGCDNCGTAHDNEINLCPRCISVDDDDIDDLPF